MLSEHCPWLADLIGAGGATGAPGFSHSSNKLLNGELSHSLWDN